MSSGAEASGLDLNCDSVSGEEDGLEDDSVSIGGELRDSEVGGTMDEMLGKGEESTASVVGTVRREDGAESHGGKSLEVEFREKGTTVGFEDFEASSQIMNLGDGRTEEERLEATSEQIEVQVDLVDGGGECSDGQLDLEERKPEGESVRLNLVEVETGEKEIADLVTVSAERSDAVDLANQDVGLGNVFGGDHKQGIDVDADGIVVDCQLGSGETNADSGKFLDVEKREDGSTELAVVSTEEFEPVEASIHAVDFHDGSGGNQKQGADSDVELELGEKQSAELVAVSAVGFEAVEASDHPMCLGDGFGDDQNRVIDVNNEDMVGTDENLTVLVPGEVAEDERLEASSNLREEQVEVELMDEGVQAVDDQLGPEEREAESKSLSIKLLEMDTEGTEGVDLVAVSAEEFKALEASNQAVMKMGTGMSESADLVVVSAKEFEAVEVSNHAASGDDQEQRIDLDAEGMVIDGQLGSGERDAEIKSLVGKFLEVDKEVEGSAVLVSVSIEEFQPVDAGKHPVDFHDGSDGDQKGGAVLDAEGMDIDGDLGSVKRQAEVEAPGGKFMEMDREDKEGAVLVSASTESDDQRLGTGLNAENMVGSNEGSVAVAVRSGRELWEVDCKEKISAELVSVSAEVFEPVETSSPENLLHRSGDDQKLVTDVDAESMVGINENSTTISVDSGGPEGERSHASLVSTKEEIEIRGDLDHGIVQAVDNELDTRNEADFKSYSGRCMETDMREKGTAKLVRASPDLFESAEASSEAVNLGNGSGGDEKQRVDVDMEGLMGTDEVSLTALVVGGGADPEKMEGSSILRKEQLEIQLDLVDESDLAAGPQLGCGEREAEVNSHEGMLVELLTGEKESAGLVAASAEDFDAIEASNQGMNSGDNSGGEQMQGIDADAKGEDLHVQLGPGSRDVEVKSHSRKVLEVDKTEEESAEPVAVSTEIFEPVEPSSPAMNFGDGSDGDQKLETDVNVEGLAMDAEWSSGKSVAEVEPIGEKFLEVNRDDEESTELPAVSTEGGFLPCQADSEPMKLVDGSGDQRLKTDVDAESVSTDEFSVALSITSGAPDDAKFVGSLILRKHVEVQDNMVDGIFEVVEGELSSPTNVTEVKSYGERFMEVDMGEKDNIKLVAASVERSVTVEVSSQTMDLGDGSSSDQMQRTDADAEGVVRNDDYVTVLVVGGAPGNETLERSRGDLTQQIDPSAKSMVDISDDSTAAPAGGGCPEDERLEEKPSVLGIEHVKALPKFANGCRQVADGELIHEESSPIIESHGGMLLGVETGVKVGAESLVISAEGCDAVEGCSQEMEVEHGSDGDQRKQTDVSSDYMVGTSGNPFNVSGSDGGLEDESLERSLMSGKDHTQVLQDLVDGHDHILDGESGPGKIEDEVDSEKLLELDVREKGAELPSIPAGGSAAVEASSQDMDYEDRSVCEQKQESNIGAACMFETVEVSVVVSVDGGGPEEEMLNGSSNLGKEVEVGEETLGTCSTGKDLPESTRNDSADYNDTTIHVIQVQTEFDGVQRQDSDVGVETMVRGTEKASLAVSVGSEGPEDKRLETSYKFGEKQVDAGEDDIGHGMPEEILVNPEKIGGDVVDATRDSGHVKDSVHNKHVGDMDSREGFVGDLSTKSCMVRMETDAEPQVVAVVHQGTEAQGLEVAPGSDDEQVKAKCGSDESQIVEKDEHFQKSGDSLNVDVCDLVEGHPDEREGEIIGEYGHNLSEVNSAFSAGEVNVCEKGLACLPECVEAVHDLMDHALDDRDPGSEGYDKERVETYGKQDSGLESFQGSELMEVETSIVHHSTVGSEQVEVLMQASSVENDPKIYDENNTAADHTVQKSDSIPVIGEQDTDLQVEDEDQKSTLAAGGTFGFFDVAKTTMALDAVNVEAWNSDEHIAVDSMAEKGNVLLEDNGSVMSAELQNGDEQVEQLNFDHQNQKIDSSSLMVSCKEEALHAAGSDSLGDFFMEDSNSLLGISIPEYSTESTITPQGNDTSVGCQDVQPPNILSREHKELEHEQRTPAVGSALHAVDGTIDYSQKLQDGTQDNLKESDNQNEGCDTTRTESASTSQQATYYLSFPERESFSTSDLVWGKVKSHPWWPGQIFDFSGASQLAIKYQKKDHFLVTYFGDKTFAWCEESRLKPFQLFFSQMEKQTSSDSFLRALHDILAEISRRVEFSMTCLCLPEETYADIKYQKIENAGLRGKIVDSIFDRSEIVNYFHPDRLIDYVRELALLPTGGADRLDLTVAQAQLKAFYLSKGYTELPAFTNGSGLVENDFETPSSMNKKLNEDLEHSATLSDLFSTKGKLRSRDGTLGKPKQIVEDGRKQKSLSELMEEETTFLLVNKHENASEAQDDENCLSCGNKRKALDFVSIDIGRSKTKKSDSQGDEETKLPSPTSNSSFKVGAFISRAASKLTSGQPMRKCHGETSERGLSKTDDWSVDYMDLGDFIDVPFDYPKLQIDISEDYPPANEMLSKLCLAARNPLKVFNFSPVVIKFFCTFRNVQVSNISIEKNITEKPRAKRGRKKKIILDLGSPDMSTPDHMKDSYWSDMVVPEKDGSVNPPKRRGRKKRKFIDESSPSLLLNSPSDCEPKLHSGTMCPHVKHIMIAERPIISVEEKIVDERTPTAVILSFNSSNSLPSETELIRIFSRYGPLKEEETYIERKNNSAMVVFKKRTDAEMAFSSAGKFSTFGSALLSYRLKHFPFKSPSSKSMIGEDDSIPIKGDLGIMAEPEFNGALDGTLCEAVDKESDMESSIFVQSQENFEPVLDLTPGEFSELAQYQVGDAVISDSALANMERKEPSQDVPDQMDSGAGSDHLLLESLDQEFSYFDLDQTVAGDISEIEANGVKSSDLLLETVEVSHDANDRSLAEESCDPVTAVLETTTQMEAVDQEFSGFALPAESKDISDDINITPDQPGEKKYSDSPPAHVGAGTSDQISVVDAPLMEADSCAMEAASDSTQVELGRQDPSVSVANAESTGIPSQVTESCISEQSII